MAVDRQHRKARQTWLKSKATAEALLESSADAMLAVCEDGRILLVNSSALTLFGYSREELIGEPLDVLLPPESRLAHVRHLAEFFRHPRRRARVAGLELSGCRKDSSEFPVEVGLSYVSTPSGPLAIACITDVSARRLAERQLQQANEMLRAIIEASPLAILAAGLDGCTTLWNRAAEHIFGWTAEEVVGQPLPTIPAGRESELAELFELTAAGSGLVNAERLRARKDGSLVEVAVWTSPLRDVSGAIRGVLSIAADITERKQLQAQLSQSQKLEALGRLAGGVAHDFNNLLTVIGGYAELALAGTVKSPARRHIEEIRKAGDRAAQLTGQLLAFGRKQASQPHVSDLNVLVRDMLEMLRRTLGEPYRVEPMLDPEPAWIYADPAQIGQVILNLVINARDAMPEGGRVRIETSRCELDGSYARTHPGVEPGAHVMLAVIDEGRGMDDLTRSRIFEPFFSTKEKGTGLGLSTVYGIVKQNNGEVWVSSAPGFGTTFEIYFPQAEAPTEAPPVPPVVALSGGHGETVLLVEDEEAVRKLVEAMLTRRGYRVISAESAHDALRVAGEHEGPIDLLLSDVVMPGMNGVDLARGLVLLRPSIKVLFMSGYADTPAHRGVLEPGMALLQKPFAAETLERIVREVLETARWWPASCQPSGGVVD